MLPFRVQSNSEGGRGVGAGVLLGLSLAEERKGQTWCGPVLYLCLGLLSRAPEVLGHSRCSASLWLSPQSSPSLNVHWKQQRGS